jgi:hypothetical protein
LAHFDFGFWPALALIQELHHDLSYSLKLNIRHSQCGRSGPGISDCGMQKLKVTAETQKAQSKTILCKNALNKRILGTAIEVLSVKKGATVVFYLLNPQRTLLLCG